MTFRSALAIAALAATLPMAATAATPKAAEDANSAVEVSATPAPKMRVASQQNKASPTQGLSAKKRGAAKNTGKKRSKANVKRHAAPAKKR